MGRPEFRTQQAAPVIVAIDAHMVGTHETGNETYVVQPASALARLGGYHYKLYIPLPQVITRKSPLLSVYLYSLLGAYRRSCAYPGFIPAWQPKMALDCPT